MNGVMSVMRRARCAAMIMIAALGACGGDQTRDAGGSPPPDTNPPGSTGDTTTVTGTVTTTCHQASGDVTLRHDLRRRNLAAYVLDPDGAGYHPAMVIARQDGTFAITGVPDGARYLLGLDRSYFETDQRALEINFEIVARCEPIPQEATEALSIDLQLATHASYVEGLDVIDQLVVLSSGAGSDHFWIPYTTKPGGGAIAARVHLRAGTELSDAAAGDELQLLHIRTESIADPVLPRKVQASHIVESASSRITLQSGVDATLATALEPAPPNRTISILHDRAQFDADYGSSMRAIDMRITVVATPFAHDPLGAKLADFDLSGTSGSSTSSLAWNIPNYAYADPFPDTWKRTLSISYVAFRELMIPNAIHPSGVSAINQLTIPYAGEVPAGPTLHPPAAAQVAGADFGPGGKLTFDGTRPLLVRWAEAPGADYYELTILHLTDAGWIEGTMIRTAATSLAIPAALLSTGEFYAFELAAVRSPIAYRSGHIGPSGGLGQIASTVSGRFRLTAQCGDGVVQSGESCDTRGESSTCNADCTLPVCGDGYRNAAAGEVCDDGGDSPGCNADCSLPVCGDGYRNTAIEDCDDGDARDTGNGCSDRCMFNRVCGDGQLQLLEGCDDGGVDTARCNADCSPASCGDGYVNRAAGEECDDGARNSDAGRCTTTCELHP